MVHFAARKYVNESVEDPLRYYDHNVCGTVNLARAMQKHGVKKLVFSSSCTVYGNPQRVPIDESHPLCAVSPYGRTKIINEDIFRDLHASDKEWRIVLLRYFNPVGAHPSGEGGRGAHGGVQGAWGSRAWAQDHGRWCHGCPVRPCAHVSSSRLPGAPRTVLASRLLSPAA